MALLTSSFALLSACQAPPRDFENENDRLRRENYDLLQSVGELNRRLEDRANHIKALEQRLSAGRPAIEGVGPADLPMAVAVKFARYTGVIDSNGDGRDDTVRIYLRSVDQHGRFIPVAARVVIQAVVIQHDQPPQMLTEMTLEPADLDKTYRTGIMGTHYTLDLPLPDPLPPSLSEITVKLTLIDAATGAVLTTEQAMRLKTK